MTDWLVILLSAPLASFGEQPGNRLRGSADRPTRSSLIGLAGAALGIERSDHSGQVALTRSFLTATRTLQPGLPIIDFHTYQSLPESKKGVSTRRDALAQREHLETSITKRTYRSGGLWQAAYCAEPAAMITLVQLRAAFQRPRFSLWLGRKSCPLDHPLVPQVIAADVVDEAFLRHSRDLPIARGKEAGLIAVDDRIPDLPGDDAARLHYRTDDPGDRVVWQFSRRAERVYPTRGSHEN
jgi:CRISPR system Cascade subunit CasD